MRLLIQTKRPETDTKQPEVDTLTKRLEIVLPVMSRHVGSNPTISARGRHSFSKLRRLFYILLH